MHRTILLLVGAGLLAPFAVARADVLDVPASRDATLYDSQGGEFANGAGDHFFAGLTGGLARRRALVAFDVAAAVPAGSTIEAVTLTLYMSRTSSGSHAVELHRVLGGWGEGASNAAGNEGGGTAALPDDATWIHRFHDNAFWTNPGGDFSGIVSASRAVGGIGFYTWTSSAMVADVQSWLDVPAGNAGWLLLGVENSGSRTSKRFDSRTYPTSTRRPRLTVTFTPPVVEGACCAPNDVCTVETAGDCANGGGTFQGVGASCSPNPCFAPTGACCYPSGACAELSGASCSFTGGIHQGDGSSCSPGTCPEPTGACCGYAGACTTETEGACAALEGDYRGNGSTCGEASCPVTLEPFVDALPIPAVAEPVAGAPGAAASYEIAVTEFPQQLHRDLPPTTVWGYGGSFPGPTIEAAAGEPVAVTWINDLRDDEGVPRTEHYLPVDLCPHGPNMLGPTPRTVVHLHGAHVEAEYDGYPEDTILPGEQQVYVYGNDQLPATLWYHDHALGITRLNVYLGLAGLYLIRDPFEQALGLPAGEHEVPLVIQDREFRADGSFEYPAMWHEHFFGDTVLVNGKVWPYLEVDRGRYRFRILNGSGSRTYRLSLSEPGLGFAQIGTDGGLLPAPVALDAIELGPAERADVIVDFGGLAPGTEVVLLNDAPAPFPGTPGEGVIPHVMLFVVGPDAGHTAPVPAALRPIEVLDEGDAVVSREFELLTVPDACSGTVWSINGLHWDDITEYPVLGTTEIWSFINRSGMTHPMHMHLVMFQVLDRQPFQIVSGTPVPIGDPVPPEPEEAGWKDTVQAHPGEITRVIARFEDYAGKFPYHCHILEHEDNDMMRQFQTIECGNGEVDPTEECDDGNGFPSDGCSALCQEEQFLVLTGTAQGGTVQISVDGVTIYGLTSTGQTPAQVAAYLASAINANSTLAARGIMARAEGGVLIVDGPLSLTIITDPGLDDRLRLMVGRRTLWWSRVAGGTATDAVRGDLALLRGTGGDFAAATGTCLVDAATHPLLEEAVDPAPGDGWWYLVRRSGSGGTYDSESPSQAAPRDPGIAASGNGCP